MDIPQNNDQPTNDDSSSKRIVQPLDEDDIKKQLLENTNLAKTNSDMLAELAAKTAELAEKVQGPEQPIQHVLELSDPNNNNLESISEVLKNTNLDHNKLKKNKVATIASNPAVDLIRNRLARLYRKEPDAASEASEAIVLPHKSKHQQYMYDLTTSGKSLADIQTSWHNYYIALTDEEKHQVWQEFYKNQGAVSSYVKHTHKTKPINLPKVKRHNKIKERPEGPIRSVSDIKARIIDKVTAGGQLKPIHHIKSALFGISFSAFIGLVIVFVFFNQVFIAPFLSPSTTISATPIIGNTQSAVSPDPKIIIPKINVEVPVVYGLGTVSEKEIQKALEVGVVHYAASPEPGEKGNSVIVGHSSNNIFNSGKYKFAFVLLRRLEMGDTFFIEKDQIRYTYKVFEKKIVAPTETSVLGPSTRENTMTLITCDPPGTSIKRLIIVAEQISPDPSQNTEAVIDIAPNLEAQLPSNSQSLWSRIIGLF